MEHLTESMIEQLRKIESFAGRLEEARQRVLLDPLTGLVSQRAAEALLQHRLASATGTALVLIRLCNLKVWNERKGHQAGDAILRAFSQLLMKHASRFDMICRWAGATFLLLANNSEGCTPADRQKLKEELSAPVELDLDGARSTASLTVALGFALALPGDDLTTLLSRAEAAIVEAAAGRN